MKRHPQVTPELVDRVYAAGGQSRSVVEDVLHAFFSTEPWRRSCDEAPPEDGSVIYGRETHRLRFTLYHPSSRQFQQQRLKGRWQIQDQYLGWENYHEMDNIIDWRTL